MWHSTEPGLGFPASSAPGQAKATGRYFRDVSKFSAHYAADVADLEHFVPEEIVAFHAPPNTGSVGFEICATVAYSRDQWLGPKVWPAVERTAKASAATALRWGIPVVRLSPRDLLDGKGGISGHGDVSAAWHESSHTDPGPNFPWDEALAVVRVELARLTGTNPTPTPAPNPIPEEEPEIMPVLVRDKRSKRVYVVAPGNATPPRWIQSAELPLLRILGVVKWDDDAEKAGNYPYLVEPDAVATLFAAHGQKPPA